jgi:23S rRNA (guanine745-N1)-methyltransferase
MTALGERPARAARSLVCTVRGCGLALDLAGRSLRCTRGHAFDLARSGYVNLLQPQDRRSRAPGDSPEAVAARRRFLDAGHEREIVARVCELAASLAGPDSLLLDVGCGEGTYTTAMREATGALAVGIDLSATAVDLAARRDGETLWVVANADRSLPLAAGSVALATSITARRTVAEMRRVVAPGGSVLVVLPAADDLAELREVALGRADVRSRAESLERDVGGAFSIVLHGRVAVRARLDRDAARDALAGTYRLGRGARAASLDAIGSLEVTLSRELFVLEPELRGGA